MKGMALIVGLVSWTIMAYAEPLRIYGYDLDYRLQPNGEGHYHALIQELVSRGVSIDLTVMPLPRAMRALRESKEHCVFPATINAIVTSYPEFSTQPLISGAPVDRISLRIFTRPGEPVISSMNELNGKRVALWSGLNPDALLSGTNAEVEVTPSEGVRVRMLNALRLDAIIGFMPDVMLVAEAENLPIPEYDTSLALFRDEGASIVCHDTPGNRATMTIFDQTLNELRTQGRLRGILGPYADIVE